MHFNNEEYAAEYIELLRQSKAMACAENEQVHLSASPISNCDSMPSSAEEGAAKAEG